MSLATFSRFSRVRATNTTVPPASAIFFAAAAPMPDDPPVMRTTLPLTASLRLRPCTASSKLRK
ncbi:Uncharacterised protein [Mycobacterium tuberculosis]|nr:Uncharacterised protein [Mycobacterium tuberculosis]